MKIDLQRYEKRAEWAAEIATTCYSGLEKYHL